MRPWCTQTLHARDPYEGRLRHQAQWNEADKQALAEIYRPGLGPVPGNHGPMETRSRRAAATTFLPILAPSRILLSPCFFFFLPLFIFFFLWLSMGWIRECGSDLRFFQSLKSLVQVKFSSRILFVRYQRSMMKEKKKISFRLILLPEIGKICDVR